MEARVLGNVHDFILDQSICHVFSFNFIFMGLNVCSGEGIDFKRHNFWVVGRK